MEAFTIDEVAKAIKLHPYTVRRLCREGKIPAFKFGGQWRFKKE
ncbi:helix-turn-helix domain-containing protein, partial [bacterium]|nr:helix-turn-helix domain-containing protein [bacterium]